MEITREQVIEYLSRLNPIQMGDLVADLEETWGVSAVAPVTPYFPPGDLSESQEEQVEFDVHLESYGEKKIEVIKTLRAELPGLGLKEAKELVESAPGAIKEAVSKEEAEELKAKLEKAGATVKIM